MWHMSHQSFPPLDIILSLISTQIQDTGLCSAGKKENNQGTVHHNEQRNQRQQRLATRVSGVYL